ncbi:TolC family protein [Leptolyngbya sp. AN03gr2]|uniref:TolC family protein n=1 Tax=unclassified Leptolyngbya TaxID=2650499 RepID=UPI003D322671
MKPSFELLALGVGVWLSVGTMGAASANPVPKPDESDSSPPNITNSRSAATPLTLSAHRDTDGDPTPPFALTALQKPSALIPKPSAPDTIAQAVPIRKPTAAKPTTAQGTPSAPLPTTGSPTPSSTPAPTNPTGAPATPSAQPPTPLTPGTGGANQLVPVPPGLEPSPNRLQFPTRPGEVQVRNVQPISLQQALELAERNNRDLEVARLQVEQSRAAIREARASNFPTLALTANLTRSGNVFISQQPSLAQQFSGVDPNSTSTAFSTGLQLDYSLFTSGLIQAQIRAVERQSRSQELQLEQTREQLRLDVSTNYYNLQNADSQVAIFEAAVRNAEASLRDARAQETAGLGTRFDTLQAEVNLANVQQQLRNAQANQEIARRQLVQTLSLSETATLTAADPVEPAGSWTIPLEDSIVLAYRNRAELEQQLALREASQAQIQAARARNGVALNLVGAYNFQRSGTTNTSTNNADSYSLALQARWSLFDGGATNAIISQRERDRDIAEARFAQNRNVVRFQVEQAYANLQANLANLNTTQQSVAQAQEALRLAALRFQAGVGTQTDRIAAEAALTQAQGNRISAVINYNLALAQLRRFVSNLSP